MTASRHALCSVVRVVLVAGLLVGAYVGFRVGAPARSSSPVTSWAQNRAAEELCLQGYNVWSREGTLIC